MTTIESKLNGKKVLIVEDNPRYMANAHVASQLYGIQASYAATLDQALELLGSENFDAVVTDLMIPQKGCFSRDDYASGANSINTDDEINNPEFPFRRAFEIALQHDDENILKNDGDSSLRKIVEANEELHKQITSCWYGKPDSRHDSETALSAYNSRGVYVLDKAKELGIPAISVSSLSHVAGGLISLIAKGYAPNVHKIIKANQGLFLNNCSLKKGIIRDAKSTAGLKKFTDALKNFYENNEKYRRMLKYSDKLSTPKDDEMRTYCYEPPFMKNTDAVLLNNLKSIYAYSCAFEHLMGNMDYVSREPERKS